MILALGVALWMGRKAEKASLTRKILLWFILIGNICSLYAFLPAVLSGSISKMIYTTIVTAVILTIWAVLLLFKKS